MSHDELARDLAGHLFGPKIMVWQNIQLGPSGSVRPDVYTIRKSYVRPLPIAYEVKVSRSDFFHDVTAGKWQSYLKYASGVIFGAEFGLLERSDVPQHCGLILRALDGRWRIAKRPVLNAVEVSESALIKLLIDGVEREGPRYRQRHFDGNAFSKKFGSTAARYVADAASVHQTIANAEYQAKQIVDRAQLVAKKFAEDQGVNASVEWSRLCDALSLPHTANIWDVRRAVASVKNAAEGGDDRKMLRQIRDTAERMMGQVDNILARDKVEV